MMQIAACSMWCTMLLRKKEVNQKNGQLSGLQIGEDAFKCKEGQF